MVPAQHVPLRDVDYRRLGGQSKDEGTKPSGAHLLRKPALFKNATCNRMFLTK